MAFDLPAKQQPALPSDAYRFSLVAMLAVSASFPLTLAVKWIVAPEPLFPDFFALWSFGRYVLTHAPATIYDSQALHGFQTGLGMPPDVGYPFFYPPWILLVLAPLGRLDYLTARVVWLVLTFAAYVAAMGAWRWPRPVMGLLVFAPSSAICFAVGQNGFLTAALMLGGIRLLRTRPLIAGALLACLAYKPQLAVLAPAMLVFGRHWRAMTGAAFCAAVLSLSATLAFGWTTWAAWLDFTGHQAASLSLGKVEAGMMPTVTSAVQLLGGSGMMAHAFQALAAMAGLLALWRVRNSATPEAKAVLPLAAILATPYAFVYDLPMVTGAVLSVVAARITAGARFAEFEFPSLLACVMVPAMLPGCRGAVAVVLPVMLAACLWRLSRAGHDANAGLDRQVSARLAASWNA